MGLSIILLKNQEIERANIRQAVVFSCLDRLQNRAQKSPFLIKRAKIVNQGATSTWSNVFLWRKRVPFLNKDGCLQLCMINLQIAVLLWENRQVEIHSQTRLIKRFYSWNSHHFTKIWNLRCQMEDWFLNWIILRKVSQISFWVRETNLQNLPSLNLKISQNN